MLRAPFSSEFDPSEEAEGSIDPLGLQPGYERLADRLLPAVTVRMGHPRFVTAMAVGACVCDEWDTDAVAADDITPPWLVWEWFVVEAFVRAEECALWNFRHSRHSEGPAGLAQSAASERERPTSKRPPPSASPACFAVSRAESEFSPRMGRSTTAATNWSRHGRRIRVWTASLMHPAATGTPSASGFGAR